MRDISEHFKKFKANAISKYGSRFDYSKSKYVDIRTKMVVICNKHGEFLTTPRTHLESKTGGCNGCKREREFEKFKERANRLHNFKFNYDKFVYVNQKTPSVIICPTHGEFIQKPDHHLRKGAVGCPKCCAENRSEHSKKNYKPDAFTRLVSKEQFLKRVHNHFGDKFTLDLSNYNELTGNKISITCPIHGKFEKVPDSFLKTACGCSMCANERRANNKTATYDELLVELFDIHGYKYCYPDANRDIYVNKSTKIEAVCYKHGKFKKRAQKFLSGQGCPRCTTDRLIRQGSLIGGYNERLFENNPKLKEAKAFLYYLSIGSLYKIGVTRRPIAQRVSKLKSASKCEVEVIFAKEMTLYQAYKKEQEILSQFKEFRVEADYSTELFDEDVMKFSIFKV